MDMKRKLETNARYLAKFKRVPVSIPLDKWPAVQQAAASAGKAASAYMLDAVLQQVARDQAQAAGAGQIGSTTEDTPTPTQDKP